MVFIIQLELKRQIRLYDLVVRLKNNWISAIMVKIFSLF